jgi:hypothetical protein
MFISTSANRQMAKNKTVGDNQRKGAVKGRSQIKNPITGTWTKRDDKSGQFMDLKADAKPFKGVRKEGGSAKELRDSARRFSGALKRLADR